MRAICLRRICITFRRSSPVHCVHPTYAIRQFHLSRLNATPRSSENAPPQLPAPRKRSRPGKVKTGETTVDELRSTTDATADLDGKKLTKPRKKTPKISDITRLIPPSSLQPSPSCSLRPYQE